jgi:hypothetical protein
MHALLGILLLLGNPIPQQATSSLRGTIVDARTNAPIADARVTLVELNRSVRTDGSGRFEFRELAPRPVTLTVSTIGYIFVRRRIDIPGDAHVEITVPLAEGTGTYQEAVTVAADTARPKAIGVSSQMELGSAALAELRGVAADDPMRAIQALPGVATGDDFQAEFSVRGSAFRHVGIVMDGTPSALLMHSVQSANDSGSIAMINSDILSRGALFGGPHARPHGDWLGATLEFDVREGSRDRATWRMAISGTSASTVLEGPIGRGRRGSWLVSLRKSYIDWLIRKIDPSVDSTIGFSDGQAKFVYDVTSRHQIQVFTVFGDATYREQQTGLANGLQRARSRNTLTSVAWRYAHERAIVTQRLSAIRASFRNRGLVGQRLADGLTTSIIWRGDVVLPLSAAWTVEGGGRHEAAGSRESLFNYATAGPSAVRLRFTRETEARPSTSGAWGQASLRRTGRAIAAGLRVSSRADQTVALPWVLGELALGRNTVRAGAGRSAQFVDPIVSALAPEPVAPEMAASYDLSVERPLGAGLTAQATAFYRREEDIVRRAGEARVNPANNSLIPESTFPIFTGGLSGTARGLDVVLVRRAERGPTGWIGYTWARTRYTDGATDETFDGDFDQRHTLNVFVQQRLSYRLAVSGKLRVGSNFPISGYFSGEWDDLRVDQVRNRVRLPVYARLDMRANRTFTFERSRLTLFVEVMNVLGRRNGGQSDGSILADRRAVGYVERLIPRVPSAGFLFEF